MKVFLKKKNAAECELIVLLCEWRGEKMGKGKKLVLLLSESALLTAVFNRSFYPICLWLTVTL